MMLFPSNTAAEYSIKLPRPITLEGDWKVALTELSVPAIFDNILRETCYIKLINKDNSLSEMYYVSAGRYTAVSLVERLNVMMANRDVRFAMHGNKVVVIVSGDYGVHFNDTLEEKLGFLASNMPSPCPYDASQKPNLTPEGVPTFFVYCDVAEHVVVGDIMAPLLRIMDMKRRKSFGKMHETPNSPLYVLLQKKDFDTIPEKPFTSSTENR